MLAQDIPRVPTGDLVRGDMTEVSDHECLFDGFQSVERGPQKRSPLIEKTLATQPGPGSGIVFCHKVRRTLLQAMTEFVNIRGQAPEQECAVSSRPGL